MKRWSGIVDFSDKNWFDLFKKELSQIKPEQNLPIEIDENKFYVEASSGRSLSINRILDTPQLSPVSFGPETIIVIIYTIKPII